MREQLTEHDVEKIREEIEYRKLVVRKEALEAVKEARAHGDLSEKFEIAPPRRTRTRTKAGFAILERMLKTAQAIGPFEGRNEVGLEQYCGALF